MFEVTFENLSNQGMVFVLYVDSIPIGYTKTFPLSLNKGGKLKKRTFEAQPFQPIQRPSR